MPLDPSRNKCLPSRHTAHSVTGSFFIANGCHRHFSMKETALIILAAFAFDLLTGDPVYRYHPVRIIGALISFFEKHLRKAPWTEGKTGGILLLCLMIFSVLTIFIGTDLLLNRICTMLSKALEIFICYSLIAVKDLVNHIKPVAQAIKNGDIKKARHLVAMTVGRDVTQLDEKDIARAAIETLAENFVDGFLSPLFWYVSGAVIGYMYSFSPSLAAVSFMLIFKTVSTLDSMVGYRTEKYIRFGWASARMDDLLNFIPARISIPVLFAGSAISGLNPTDGLKAAANDRLKHDSPNSAHSESFFAGALHIRLGGPAMYGDNIKKRPWIAKENPDPAYQDIDKAIRLVLCASCISILVAVFTTFLSGMTD